MALLRAVADAIDDTARDAAEHDGPWTADRAFPPAADLIPRAREMGASAIRDGAHPRRGQNGERRSAWRIIRLFASELVTTTSAGARGDGREGRGVRRRSDRRRASRTTWIILDGLIEGLRERGFRRILTEGGSTSLMGSMLEASAVDELFVTISPKLLGGEAIALR